MRTEERSPLRGICKRRDVPTFRLLCVMTHHVLDAIGSDAPTSEIIAALKDIIARAGLDYPPPDHFAAVADAVRLARTKGYLTPRRRCRATKAAR